MKRALFIATAGLAAVSADCTVNGKAACNADDNCVWTAKTCVKDKGCPVYAEKALCLSGDNCLWADMACVTNKGCKSYAEKYRCAEAGCYWDGEEGTNKGCLEQMPFIPCHDHTSKFRCDENVRDCVWSGERCVNKDTCWTWDTKFLCRGNGCYWHKDEGVCKREDRSADGGMIIYTCDSYKKRSKCRKAGCFWSGYTKTCGHLKPYRGCEAWDTPHKCKHRKCFWNWFDKTCQSGEHAFSACANRHHKMNRLGCNMCLNGGSIGHDGECVCADGWGGLNCESIFLD